MKILAEFCDQFSGTKQDPKQTKSHTVIDFDELAHSDLRLRQQSKGSQFMKPRWQRHVGRHQTTALMNKTMKLHVRNTIWLVSPPSSAKQQRENEHLTKFCEESGCAVSNFLWRMRK